VLYLGKCYLPTLLVKRKHHGEAVPQGEVIPGDVKPPAALVGPDRTDARPDFLTGLVLTRASAVVEDVGWCVGHRNAVSDTAFQCRGLAARVNTSYREINRLKEKRSRMTQTPVAA
jgi:hypothetical protein